ncbi:50S ribosomal protein L25/general stress protein Ctc [Desulfitibacter alkalitolerans]|uniref:50S ribosomal protein L25/general stress protein Ctc n=1 Tax=Desulfitibacter alkalitolerans TaxID=264641 RepID=UPI000481C299|nr:50S ribosomal protein L25/general stress protein Ctc [Desulfitibacter alkalitolerans]
METVLIQAQMRNEQTKGSNSRVRREGFVPGVLYGKEVENTSILVPEKELEKIIAKSGENAFAKISLHKDNGPQEYNVILKEVQRHPFKGTLVHLDFYQVSMSEKLNTVVPISLVGESMGAAEGGIVQQQLREISVRCLPGDIPGSIEVDITNLQIGDSITAADVQTPDKVEIVEDPSTVVVSVSAPRAEEEAEEAETHIEGPGEEAVEEAPEAEDTE